MSQTLNDPVLAALLARRDDLDALIEHRIRHLAETRPADLGPGFRMVDGEPRYSSEWLGDAA